MTKNPVPIVTNYYPDADQIRIQFAMSGSVTISRDESGKVFIVISDNSGIKRAYVLGEESEEESE